MQNNQSTFNRERLIELLHEVEKCHYVTCQANSSQLLNCLTTNLYNPSAFLALRSLRQERLVCLSDSARKEVQNELIILEAEINISRRFTVSYDFNQLNQEISRLKEKDFSSELKTKSVHLTELVNVANERLSTDLKPIFYLYLNTLKQIDSEIIQGQLQVYETILQIKLTPEIVQQIKGLQKEIIQLEQHLTDLQQIQNTEQISQIVQMSSNN